MTTNVAQSIVRLPHAARRSPRGWVAVLALTGGVLLAAGVLLPWLTLYAGLQSLNGMQGVTGPILLAGALASMALGIAALRLHAARSLLPIVGFGLLAYTVYLLIGLLGLYRELAAQPLDVAALGPGLPVAVIGAGLVFVTAFVPADMTSRPASAELPSRPMLVAGLLVVLTAAAGVAHLYLTPEHLGESTLLGVGFAVAGVAQLVMAVLVLARPSRRLLVTLIVVNAALVVLYAWNVLLGLPIVGPETATAIGHGHEAAEHAHEGGLVIGLGEPVDLWGVGTKAAELLGILFAALLLRNRARREHVN